MLTNRQEILFFSTLGGILFVFLAIIYVFGRGGSEDLGRIHMGTPAPVSDVSVTAKAAYVYDTGSGMVLYAKNEHQRLPLASVVKAMSALVASEIAPPESVVTVSREAVAADGDSGLLVGERWLLRDLIDFSLVGSSNDGVRAMALSLGALASSSASVEESVNDFVQKMNARAASLGMKDTYYFNDTGLDESAQKGGAYGSARDQAVLFDYLLREKPYLLAATREPMASISSLDGFRHIVANTDGAIDFIPSIIASKTGYTDLAGGNLVIAFDAEIGRPVIISVLGSTYEGRFADALALVDASLRSIQNSVVQSD